jgi:hypothetical protein
MKHIFRTAFSILSALLLILQAAAFQAQTGGAVEAAKQENLLKDQDGNTYTSKVMLDGLYKLHGLKYRYDILLKGYETQDTSTINRFPVLSARQFRRANGSIWFRLVRARFFR